MTQLTQYRGDTVAHAIATDEQFDLMAFTSLIFTAKKTTYDPDVDAIIQKVLGVGLAVTGAQLATVDIVPQDTATLENDALNLVWDIQGQLATGAIHTLACGTLVIDRDVTIETASSIPIFTTNPPANTGGGAAAYVHTQTVESDEWVITHNLGYWPVVEVYNVLGRAVTAGVRNVSLNETRITFNVVTTGIARLI